METLGGREGDAKLVDISHSKQKASISIARSILYNNPFPTTLFQSIKLRYYKKSSKKDHTVLIPNAVPSSISFPTPFHSVSAPM